MSLVFLAIQLLLFTETIKVYSYKNNNSNDNNNNYHNRDNNNGNKNNAKNNIIMMNNNDNNKSNLTIRKYNKKILHTSCFIRQSKTRYSETSL